MRSTLAVAVVVCSLTASGLGACSPSEPAPDPGGAVPPRDHAPTGPPGAGAGSTPPPLAAPVPDNAGEDPAAAVRAIVLFRHRLLRAPDPADVGLIYAPACSCADALRTRVEEFLLRGYRLEARPPVVTDTRVLERVGALATVRYTVRSRAGVIRDATGRVVGRGGPGELRRFESQLLRTGGRWLVQTIREVRT